MKLFSNRTIGASPWGFLLAILGTVSICAGTLGCGMAASPQPPSLQLPKPVRDLTAARAGNQVDLRWNTPSETTDRLKIHQPVALRICRQLGGSDCETVARVSAVPGKPAEYADTLPPALSAGPLRVIAYEIFGINKHNRSAGPSNAATTLAGEAPPPVQSLSASMIESGVLLRWQAVSELPADTSIRLQRKLLATPAVNANARGGGLPAVSEPVEQSLRVPPATGHPDPGTVLDICAEFNRKYQYMATRITWQKSGAESIQIASAPSTPAVIVTQDTFPPAAPAGLAVVPVPASLNNGAPEVDLSWSANTEQDLAQYLVYRRDLASSAAAGQIGPENAATPIVAPAFRDTRVQPGHTYAYSILAVDNAGNRSRHSAEVVASVPGS